MFMSSCALRIATYSPQSNWGQWHGYWQTLIAGLLAVAAALVTVGATNRAAQREGDAANL
jgi:hypothetical protein